MLLNQEISPYTLGLAFVYRSAFPDTATTPPPIQASNSKNQQPETTKYLGSHFRISWELILIPREKPEH